MVITGRYTLCGMQHGGLERGLDQDSENVVQEPALLVTSPRNLGLSGIQISPLQKKESWIN